MDCIACKCLTHVIQSNCHHLRLPHRGVVTAHGGVLAMSGGYGHEQQEWTCAASLATHFKNCDSHWKPSAYPMRFATLTMKSSTGRATSVPFLASLPYVMWL